MVLRVAIGVGVVVLALTMANVAAQQEVDRLPDGEVDAGREAFADLGCDSCHTVAGGQAKTVVSAHPGPQLGAKQAEYGPVRIAVSIVAPSHEVAPAYLESLDAAGSPMGDYSEAMTVRQLLDLVAYIRSLEAPQ